MFSFLQRNWPAWMPRFARPTSSAEVLAPSLSPDLVSRLSHEMRTSLTGIVGYAEFIEEGAEPAMVNFTAKIIRESSQALARSLQSFVDLHQLHTAPSAVMCSEIAVASLMHDLVQEHQSQALARDVSLIFNATEHVQSMVLCSDRQRFTHMLEALLAHALNSATRSSVVVLGLGWHSDQQAFEVALYELGAAVDPEQSRLLQQFWHDPHYVYQLQAGPGLSLALAKALMHSLQGRAEFKSVRGQGDQLRVWLPQR